MRNFLAKIIVKRHGNTYAELYKAYFKNDILKVSKEQDVKIGTSFLPEEDYIKFKIKNALGFEANIIIL